MRGLTDHRLTKAAAALARTAPNAWQEFLSAFEGFTEARKDECIRSSLEELMRAQGRAQLSVSLFALLGDAVKDADRISNQTERRNNEPRSTRHGF